MYFEYASKKCSKVLKIYRKNVKIMSGLGKNVLR